MSSITLPLHSLSESTLAAIALDMEISANNCEHLTGAVPAEYEAALWASAEASRATVAAINDYARAKIAERDMWKAKIAAARAKLSK